MTDDLISRQAAMDALAKLVPYAICDTSTESYTNGLTDAYNLICQLPSAQTERKKGKWIEDKDGCLICDLCGNPAEINCISGEFIETNYCSECEADMRG